MYILREFCQHLINHVVYCIPHKQSTTLLNSVLQNKGGATSPISQLDTVWSQEDRHDPTWFLKPLKQTTFPQFKQSRAIERCCFYSRHPSILLCFFTVSPPHHPYKVTAALYTLVAAFKKPSHSTVLVSGKGHCGLCLFWTFHRLEPVLLYIYSFYSGPP